MSEAIKNQDNPLLKRAYIFLEDKDWRNAENYFEKTLDTDPENARAYMGLLLVKLKASNIDELLEKKKFSKWSGDEILFYEEDYFKKALKYADSEYIKGIGNLKEECIYRCAIADMENGNYDTAMSIFLQIPHYKDVDTLKYECLYKKAITLSSGKTIGSLEKAISIFEQMPDYKDTNEMKGKISDKITQMKKDRKKAIIIVTTILVIFSVLFTWWASVRIMQNKTLANEIMENFNGKEFKCFSFEVEENAGIIHNSNARSFTDPLGWEYDKDTFDFKEFAFNEKTVILSHEHSEYALFDDGLIKTIEDWNTQKKYLYSIKVSFFKEIILSFNNNDYVITVNDKNEPIQFVKDEQIYKIKDITENKLE